MCTLLLLLASAAAAQSRSPEQIFHDAVAAQQRGAGPGGIPGSYDKVRDQRGILGRHEKLLHVQVFGVEEGGSGFDLVQVLGVGAAQQPRRLVEST